MHSICSDIPRKITSLGESLAESHAYNPIRDSGETLGEREVSPRDLPKVSPRVSERVSARLLVRLSARLLAKFVPLAKRFARLSPRLVFLRGVLKTINREKTNFGFYENPVYNKLARVYEVCPKSIRTAFILFFSIVRVLCTTNWLRSTKNITLKFWKDCVMPWNLKFP